MVNAVLLDIFQKSDLNTVDCAFDTGSCVAGALSSPHNIAIAYTYGTEPVKSAAQPYIINLSDITSQPITPDIVPQPGISASSVLENFNAEGLLYSTQPGWHAQKNPAYPQSITINFVMNKRIESIGFLPQDDNADRMPKHIKIETSENGSEWVTSGVYQDLCASKGADGWHQEKLPTPTEARYLRINIYSNCGNPNLLTLRGFRASP
ncbi:hypothetical protein GCM10011491_46560 [Brucella endophytica]|uniref:F5/8 type C domain-containing protein n=2 Tax=Brucella endophytica TaxID=1963359 RepID=A0A916WN33_9HYPH|nr:hypothetical protein GCM10011491_46560 [Brucella endophytica]